MGNDLEKKRAQVGAIPAVRVIPHYEDEKSFFKDLTVSKTIPGAAGLMGEVANVNISGISIIPRWEDSLQSRDRRGHDNQRPIPHGHTVFDLGGQGGAGQGDADSGIGHRQGINHNSRTNNELAL